MPVLHSEFVRRLTRAVMEKGSHGQRDLLALIARLEAECSVDTSQYEQFLAVFGDELEEAFLNIVPPPGADATPGAERPLTDTAASVPAMEVLAPPSTATAAKEQNPCQQSPSPPPPTTPPPTPLPSRSASPSRSGQPSRQRSSGSSRAADRRAVPTSAAR